MRLVFFVSLLLLSACTERQPPEAAAPAPVPGASGEAAPPGPAPQGGAAVAVRSARPCGFEDVWQAVPSSATDDDIPLNVWTPWLTDSCLLAEFNFQAAQSSPLDPAEPYANPIILPNAAGRRLYLVQDAFGGVALLEREATRFRVSRLGNEDGFGGLSYRLHHLSGTTLLELTNRYGAMGAGRGASGSATTYLQVYDVAQDRWLMKTAVGRIETSTGYEDEQGRNVAGQDQEVTREYRVMNQGRTVVLGKFAIDTNPDPDVRSAATDSFPALPPPLFGSESAPPDAFPPGTYQLTGGRYRRVR